MMGTRIYLQRLSSTLDFLRFIGIKHLGETIRRTWTPPRAVPYEDKAAGLAGKIGRRIGVEKTVHGLCGLTSWRTCRVVMVGTYPKLSLDIMVLRSHAKAVRVVE